MIRLPEERGVVGRNHVEKLHQLLAGAVGFQVVQVAALVLDAQGAHAFAHPGGHQCLLVRAQRDAGLFVRVGTEALEDHVIHESLARAPAARLGCPPAAGFQLEVAKGGITIERNDRTRLDRRRASVAAIGAFRFGHRRVGCTGPGSERHWRAKVGSC